MHRYYNAFQMNGRYRSRIGVAQSSSTPWRMKVCVSWPRWKANSNVKDAHVVDGFRLLFRGSAFNFIFVHRGKIFDLSLQYLSKVITIDLKKMTCL